LVYTLTHPWAKNEQIPIKRHVTSLSSEVCRLLNKCTNSVSCRRYLLIFLQIHWKWIMQEIFLDWGTSRFALLTNKIFMGSIGNQISRIGWKKDIFIQHLQSRDLIGVVIRPICLFCHIDWNENGLMSAVIFVVDLIEYMERSSKYYKSPEKESRHI
jgi:hypothetical protein